MFLKIANAVEDCYDDIDGKLHLVGLNTVKNEIHRKSGDMQ